MTDIVERLRDWNYQEVDDAPRAVMCEAADEIERLRERVAELQATSGYEDSIARVEIERLRAEGKLWKSRVDEACAVLERRELAFDRMQDEIEQLREAVENEASGASICGR